MGRFSVKYLTLLIILLIFSAAVILVQLFSTSLLTKVDLDKIPLDIGEWHGKNIIVDDITKKILETDYILYREYKKGGSKVWLLVVYYRDNRVSLSLPECYSAGYGSYIAKSDLYEANSPINRLVLEGKGWKKVLFYYFETANLKSSTYWAMRWQMILNRLKSENNSGALIRTSCKIKDNLEGTTQQLDNFTREISPFLSKYLFNR